MAVDGTDLVVVLAGAVTLQQFVAPCDLTLVNSTASVSGTTTGAGTITLYKNGAVTGLAGGGAAATAGQHVITNPANTQVATQGIAVVTGDVYTIGVISLPTGATALSASITLWFQRAL